LRRPSWFFDNKVRRVQAIVAPRRTCAETVPSMNADSDGRYVRLDLHVIFVGVATPRSLSGAIVPSECECPMTKIAGCPWKHFVRQNAGRCTSEPLTRTALGNLPCNRGVSRFRSDYPWLSIHARAQARPTTWASSPVSKLPRTPEASTNFELFVTGPLPAYRSGCRIGLREPLAP
jgi:hypothetical protein